MGETISVGDRAAFVQAIVQKFLLPVMAAKGKDYTEYAAEVQKKSANANFVAIADMLQKREGVDKYIVWSVYWLKHVQSLLSWITTRKLESEGLEGRLTDAINYLFILWSMLVEDGILPNPLTEE